MSQNSGWRWTQAKYAFVGLLGSDAVLLFILLINAMRIRSELLALHVGQPGQQIGLALQIFAVYGFVLFVGWLMVGLPIAMLLPAESLFHLPLLLKLLISLASGPTALFLIFVILSRGHIYFPESLTNTGWSWVLSVVMSTLAFWLYVALLRRKKGSNVFTVPSRHGRLAG
jgi:hypothetical protein